MRRAFTDEQVAVIQKRLATGETTRALAEEYGVTTTTIKNVRRGLYVTQRKKTGPKARPLSERLWEKIEQRGPDDCWPWLGTCRNGKGTPQIGVGAVKTVTAYRALYEVVHGVTLQPSDNVLHSCRDPRCMNPAHLYCGTKQDWANQLCKNLTEEEAQQEIERQRALARESGKLRYNSDKERAKQQTLEYQLERKLAAVIYKGGSCMRCGETHPAALQFHHRDPDLKSFDVNSKTLSMPRKIPWQEMRQEIDKCDLLCANCHSKYHSAWTPIMIERKQKVLSNYGLANIYEGKFK